MVLVAPPDAGRGRRRVPRHRAGQPRVRPVGPAAGARGALLGGPRRRRARHPRRPLHPQGVPGGQGLRRDAGVRLRAAAPGPHPRRGVPGHPLQPRALRLRRHHAGGLLPAAVAPAGAGGGGLRAVRRPARGAHHLRALLRRRGARRRARPGDHGPRRRLRAAAGVVHGGGPRRVRRALREVRLRVPDPNAVRVHRQDGHPAGRQVRGAGADGDGGEGLRHEAAGVRGRREGRHDGRLRAGPQGRLRPRGQPFRAGAVPGAGQRAPPRLPQGSPVIPAVVGMTLFTVVWLQLATVNGRLPCTATTTCIRSKYPNPIASYSFRCKILHPSENT